MKMLGRRREHHELKFLKEMLSKTLVIWRKKQLSPPMHFWRTKARCMTLYIKLRAVLHLQRTLRGRVRTDC